MLDSLYAKTFLILGSQLGATWLSTVVLLSVFRRLCHSRVVWVSGTIDAGGNLDMALDWDAVKPYFWGLLAADIAVFLALLHFGQSNLLIGIPLFTFWSMLTGIELALCLVAVDENLGAKVLALTALITCSAALVGTRSGIDFSFLEEGLLAALLILVGVGIVRILYTMQRWVQRLWASFGTIVFTGYLLYDFQRLGQQNADAGVNTWSTAMSLSIEIYLDVVNLFLLLLDFTDT